MNFPEARKLTPAEREEAEEHRDILRDRARAEVAFDPGQSGVFPAVDEDMLELLRLLVKGVGR